MTIVTCYPSSVTVLAGGGGIWTNESNTLVEDGSFATVPGTGTSGGANVISKMLRFVFDYSAIPDGATITAWTFRIKRKTSDETLVDIFTELSRYDVGSYVDIMVGFAYWNDALEWEEITVTGGMPTTTALKAANSSLDLEVNFTGGSLSDNRTASVDAVESVITYTDPGDPKYPIGGTFARANVGLFHRADAIGTFERLT